MIRLNEEQQARLNLLKAKLKSLKPEERAAALALLAQDDPDLAAVLRSSLGHPVSLMDLSPGDVVEKFTLLELLSSGGFGDVWKAAQAIEGGSTIVRAIKFLRPELLFSEETRQHYIAGFRAEMKFLAEVQHPHIVPFIDSGIVPLGIAKDDVPFLVMAYRESSPLWPAPALPAAAWARVEFMREVCDAVHCIHEHGLLHRDLSPNNVRVLSNGAPIVIDFGLAAKMEPALADQPALVRTATLPYTAPEQFPGGPGEVRRQTDVHALGVLLFQLLTDKLPYRFESHFSKVQIIEAIRTQERLKLGDFRDDLPALQPIVDRAIQRSPAARYATAGELRDALAGWLKESSTAPAAVVRNITVKGTYVERDMIVHGGIHFH